MPSFAHHGQSFQWCCDLPFGMAGLQRFLLSLFLSFAIASSLLVNITVDDTLGDPTTGALPKYSPNDEIWNLTLSSEDCPFCDIDLSTLDPTQIYKQTWHDAMYLSVETPATVSVRFNGTAVYVFNILAKMVPGTAMSNISFSIDGEHVGRFIQSPESSTDTLYNQLVYRNTTLNDGPHTLIMAPADLTLVIFDYLIYTTQSNNATLASASTSTPQPLPSVPSSTHLPSPASSSTTTLSTSNPVGSFHSSSAPPPRPVKGIVGAVLGCIVLLASGVVVGAFLLCRKYKRRRSTSMRRPPASALNYENNYDCLRERRRSGGRRGEVGAQPAPAVSQTVAISPLRSPDGVTTMHNPLNPAAGIQIEFRRPESTLHTSLRATVGASPETSAADQSSKHRVEITQRLETLQRARSVLSSHAPSESRRSRSEASSEGRTEAAIRDLEAEIAQLRGVLAAMNVRFVDGGPPMDNEPLPAYEE